MALSIKLPLSETALVTSVKLPLKEKAWIVYGFLITERVVEWKEDKFLLAEAIKSRIILDCELLDKNHVKFKWYGESVPILQFFKRREGEETWSSIPFAEVEWNKQEYIMLLDGNGHEVMVKGINGTGEADIIALGMSQDYEFDVKFKLPLNEKAFFIDVNYYSEYRIEVNY